MRGRQIRKGLSELLSVKTLQPGYVVITYDPAISPGPGTFKIRDWDEMKAKGFFGGICFPKGVEMQSWSDEELARAGLQRIPAVTQAAKP